MVKYIIAIILSVVSAVSMAQGESFKAQTLKDYRNRCQEVLTDKGYSPVLIEEECTCEVNVVDEKFSTFSLMLLAAKGMVGNDMKSDPQILELREKLKECRKRK